MNRGQFIKVSLRGRQKKGVTELQWPLLKYIMRKQQIQQMSSLSQDNGLIIFFKFKHLFFPDVEEDEQIINIVREDPIKSIGKVLVTITQYYSENLVQVIQTLEEEKNNSLNRLKQTQQKLQHYMDDNEYFKTIIDRLQEQKKDIQYELNQSQDQIERTHQQCETMIDEKQKIKEEVKGIYSTYQSILAENSQLRNINIHYQKEILLLRQQNQQLIQANQKISSIIKSFEEQKMLFLEQNCRLRDQNQAFVTRINQKEDFIASFISQYNKIHYFQRHQDSYNDTDKVAVDNSKDSDYNELRGFNFNQFDKDSLISEKSSKKSSVKVSSTNKSNQKNDEMDQKFLYVNATAEKLKIPLPHKTTGSQNKSRGQGNFPAQQRKKIKGNEKNTLIKQVFQDNKQIKALAKAESSKNFINREVNVTPSDAQGSKMNIQEVLRKKLLEKNAKLSRLQFELNSLRIQYIQQRQNITEMEGKYEIQIDELKNELKYMKTQFTTLYQKYVLANSYYEIYQDKVNELQDQLARIEEEHHFYCQELKRRCKLYIIKKLDQAEVHYQTIRSIQYSTKKKEQPERQYKKIRNIQKFHTQQPYIQQGEEQNLRQTLSLKLHEDNQDNQENYQSQQLKQERSSDIYSYQHLSNHHVNGLGLDLEFSLTNKNNDGEQLQEIYIRENFQIESDLGGFTQRMMEQKNQSSKYKGNFTDRVPAKMLKSMIEIKIRNKIAIESNVFSLDIDPILKNIDFCPLYELTVYPIPKIFQICSQINEQIPPLKKKLCLASNECNYGYFASKNLMMKPQSMSIKIQLFKERLDFKLCKLASISIVGKQKQKMQLATNVFSFLKEQSEKRSTISNFMSVYHSLPEHQEYGNSLKLSTSSTSTQTVQIQNSIQKSDLNGKSKLDLFKVSSLQFCNISKKQQNQSLQPHNSSNDCNLSQSMISLPKSHNQQEKKGYPIKQGSADQQQMHLIISRLDQFYGQEIQVKSNYELNNSFHCEHRRINSIESQQMVADYHLKHHPNFKSIELEKDQDNMQQKQSGIRQKTKASTEQTSVQWHQIQKVYKNIDKQSQNQQYVQKLPQNDAALYSQERINDALNKAVILSNKHSQKGESQTSSFSFNPESKHNRAATQAQDCHITPWFIDEKKHLIINNQIISIQNLPTQLVNSMQPENLGRLGKFLKENRIILKFLHLVQGKNFIRPNNLTKKLLILKATDKGVSKTYLLASKFLYCLQDKTKITSNKQVLINEHNFALGQSEIVISREGKLMINRSHKRDILSGNIEDGVWEISSYMAFEYKSKNNK